MRSGIPLSHVNLHEHHEEAEGPTQRDRQQHLTDSRFLLSEDTRV